MFRKSNPFQCLKKTKKSIQNGTKNINQFEKLMEIIDTPYSGSIEPDFRPVFPKSEGDIQECRLHYYDPEDRDDLSVLVALAPFGWKKIRCSRIGNCGHYEAHFALPKDYVEPFQFKFIVDNEYILCPAGGEKIYDTVTTEDGFVNNIVDPKVEFKTSNPGNGEQMEQEQNSKQFEKRQTKPQGSPARSVLKFLTFPKKTASPVAGEKKKGFSIRLPSIRKTRCASEEVENGPKEPQ